jgi:glucose-6-phosphate-specific signal transduction histidine kinase
MKIRPIFVSKFFFRILIPLAWFVSIFLGQLNLGYEFALSPLYIIPVLSLSWNFGWKGTAVGVTLAVCLWIWASALSGQEYSDEWIRYYNGVIRGVVYLTIGTLILLFKRTLDKHRRRMEAMQSMLNVCHGCGAVQGSDGRWIPMDQLLTYRATPQNECPTCESINGH